MVESRAGALLWFGRMCNLRQKMGAKGLHWQNDNDLCKPSKTFTLSCTVLRLSILGDEGIVLNMLITSRLPIRPGWRNWQTQRTQNPPRFTPRGGSTPPPGTS